MRTIELQHQRGGKEDQTDPLLIKIDTKSGHGAGKPTDKRLEESAFRFAFIASRTGLVWKE